MIPFAYQRVRSAPDAITAALAGGRYIAGGTTLIDLMREEVERPETLVDINDLPLTDIRLEADGLVLGALARMAEVAGHLATVAAQPLIVEALLEGASPQLRNMATIGGNLLQRVRCPYFRTRDAACNKRLPGSGCAAIGGINAGHAILGTSDHCVATHPSDLAVALVALDAVVHAHGPDGERVFPVEELYRLPGDTPHLEHSLLPGELITAVTVPHGTYSRRARYLKVRDRASYEFALVSVATALDIEDGLVRSARIAAGGVGTRPWRLRACETALVGQRAGPHAWQAAAEAAVAGARPLPGNHYKIELLRRTVVRALAMAGDPS
ncbi:FAD binding domain-containing protein [Phreatobacter stygius]|uniref:Xanthine dehydrogenase family protein subunit M n=1 Tax=Phreatobacter stygius TaxID=1940610 RepID=A0A4D7B776_9HYPH|nr:xanthine dehydrogenase family protein subunit M [Phreatobacter stygius]QCI64002.1 xanthine dehydrogenase family protein subunit M [Phreatobacter stygius]